MFEVRGYFVILDARAAPKKVLEFVPVDIKYNPNKIYINNEIKYLLALNNSLI